MGIKGFFLFEPGKRVAYSKKKANQVMAGL